MDIAAQERRTELEGMLKRLDASAVRSKIARVSSWYKEKECNMPHKATLRTIKLVLRTCLKCIVEIHDGAKLGLCGNDVKKFHVLYCDLHFSIQNWKSADSK